MWLRERKCLDLRLRIFHLTFDLDVCQETQIPNFKENCGTEHYARQVVDCQLADTVTLESMDLPRHAQAQCS